MAIELALSAIFSIVKFVIVLPSLYYEIMVSVVSVLYLTAYSNSQKRLVISKAAKQDGILIS